MGAEPRPSQGSVSDSEKSSHCQTMPTPLTPMLEKQEAVSRDEQVKNENSNESSIVGTLGDISEHKKSGGQGTSTYHLTTNENLIDISEHKKSGGQGTSTNHLTTNENQRLSLAQAL